MLCINYCYCRILIYYLWAALNEPLRKATCFCEEPQKCLLILTACLTLCTCDLGGSSDTEVPTTVAPEVEIGASTNLPIGAGSRMFGRSVHSVESQKPSGKGPQGKRFVSQSTGYFPPPLALQPSFQPSFQPAFQQQIYQPPMYPQPAFQRPLQPEYPIYPGNSYQQQEIGYPGFPFPYPPIYTNTYDYMVMGRNAKKATMRGSPAAEDVSKS